MINFFVANLGGNMKEFKVKQNKILEQEINGYYNCDYVGYQKQGNPDFINRLKNMSKQYTELDLVDEFIEVTERFSKDIEAIIKKKNYMIVSFAWFRDRKQIKVILKVNWCSKNKFLFAVFILIVLAIVFILVLSVYNSKENKNSEEYKQWSG